MVYALRQLDDLVLKALTFLIGPFSLRGGQVERGYFDSERSARTLEDEIGRLGLEWLTSREIRESCP